MIKYAIMAGWLLVSPLLSSTAHASILIDVDCKAQQAKITGEIDEGDYAKFAWQTSCLKDDAVIGLNSPGGLLPEGIKMANLIRLNHWRTFAGNCYSACALMWLGGSHRFVDHATRVGYHQSYSVTGDGKKAPSVVANAIIGAFIARLGYDDDVVEYVVSQEPDGILIMTWQAAQYIGATCIDECTAMGVTLTNPSEAPHSFFKR